MENDKLNQHLAKARTWYVATHHFVKHSMIKKWDKWLMLILVVYFISRQEIRFEIVINGKPLSGYFAGDGGNKHKASLLGDVIQHGDNIQIIDEPEPPPRPEPTAKDYADAKEYSNLGFVLNPGLIEKKGLSPGIAEVKLRKIESYLREHSSAAVSDMHTYGIPASVKLAQALLESNVGESRLATQNNNHFGIKCFSRTCKKGHCANFTDDSHKDFFRNYHNVSESYAAHSQFLQKQRYAHLKKFGTKDYQSWAHGLKKAGYATDPRYPQKLISIIEALKLYQYD